MDIDFCLSSPQEFLSMTSDAGDLGGTGLQEPPALYISSSTSTDFNDGSSDDGEQLQTPVNLIDPQQLVHIAYPPGLGGPLAVDSDPKPHATEPPMQLVSKAQSHSSASPPKSLPPPYKDFLGLPDSSLRSSPLSDPDMLYTTTLLDSKNSLNGSINDTSLELYPNFTSSLDVPPISHVKTSGALRTTGYRVFEFDSPSSLSKSRKRAPSNQSPLSEGQSERRPKYSRAHASEYLPSTLGCSYSARFPAGHRLRSDFVRQYRLEAELGAGGYGFVMAAKHRYDGHEVAVKFIQKDKIPKHGWSRDDTGQRVPKEAMLLSIVSHSGIVRFYDLFEDIEYFYLVQELHGTPWQSKKINSQTLQPTKLFSAQKTDENQQPVVATPTKSPLAYTPANTPLKGPHQYHSLNPHTPDDPFAIDAPSLLPQPNKTKAARPNFARRASHDLFECIEQSKHKRFDEKDAKFVFAQVVEVVEYLDSLGISHCDLKDENVVIDKNLKIKIIDFGSVVFSDPKEPRPFYRRFFGTAAYASPEIIDERPYQAAPAEIWALGVLLSYLVTGLSPFRSEEDKRKGRITIEEAHAKRMSPSCYNLLQRCLEVDPEKRATIREVKAHPWFTETFDGEHSRQ